MRTTLRVLLVSALAASPALAAEDPFKVPDLSADMEVTAKGAGDPIKSRIYSSGDKQRHEMSMQGRTMTSIFDYKAKKAYMLLPPPIGCMKQDLPDDARSPQAMQAMMKDAKVSEEKLGEETIDGHPTVKYRMTVEHEGKTSKLLLWRAKDLANLPIKNVAEDGSYEMVYKNVKLGKPDAKLFEAPADCKDAAQFGAGMMGGAPKKP